MFKLSPAKLAFVAILAAGAAASPFHAAESQHRLALIIGNADYKSGPLGTVTNDASLLARSLQESGFEVTAARDLDLNTLKKSLQDFTNKLSVAGPDAVAFVYLGGYAVQLQGENYYLPVDAKVVADTDVPFQGIKISDFLRGLNTGKVKTRFFVLDAAHTLPFAKNANLTPGLAYIEPEAGSLVAFNASPGFVAPDSTGANSVYVSALSDFILKGGLQPDDLFGQVRLKVTDVTKSAEVPWHLAKLETPFTFKDAVAPPAPVAAKSAEPPKTVQVVKPVEPKPADVKPVEVAKPAEPPKPIEVAKPAEVVKPVEVAKPAPLPVPEKPVEIAKPVKPVAPAKPVEMAKPLSPIKPLANALKANEPASPQIAIGEPAPDDSARLEAERRKLAAKQAADKVKAREEANLWRDVDLQDTPAAYQSYLNRFPHGKHAAEARQSLRELAQLGYGDNRTTIEMGAETAPPPYRQRINPGPRYGQLYDEYGDPIPMPPRGVYNRHRYVDAQDPEYEGPVFRRFFDDLLR